jgi:hypothetical protein
MNNRDRNFTRAKVVRRQAQLEESVARYLSQLDTADRQEPSQARSRSRRRASRRGPETVALLSTASHTFALPSAVRR